jgi:hypothetical protein
LAGQVLAALGDDRPGVGVVTKDGWLIPDIVWGRKFQQEDILLVAIRRLSKVLINKRCKLPIRTTYPVIPSPVPNFNVL